MDSALCWFCTCSVGAGGSKMFIGGLSALLHSFFLMFRFVWSLLTRRSIQLLEIWARAAISRAFCPLHDGVPLEPVWQGLPVKPSVLLGTCQWLTTTMVPDHDLLGHQLSHGALLPLDVLKFGKFMLAACLCWIPGRLRQRWFLQEVFPQWSILLRMMIRSRHPSGACQVMNSCLCRCHLRNNMSLNSGVMAVLALNQPHFEPLIMALLIALSELWEIPSSLLRSVLVKYWPELTRWLDNIAQLQPKSILDSCPLLWLPWLWRRFDSGSATKVSGFLSILLLKKQLGCAVCLMLATATSQMRFCLTSRASGASSCMHVRTSSP